MALKRHHKWIIGSSGFIIIAFMVIIGVFTYSIYIKQEVNYNLLNKKMDDFKIETQSNINSLSEELIETKSELESQLGTFQEEVDVLKASAGEDFSGIIESAVEGVVTIRTDISQGTGFIIDENGYVVTNYHVMQNAQAATIITYDNENHRVSLIGYDPDFDIALLKISGSYHPLTLGDSDDVQVGERVIAIGNPLGLGFSVTQGIVSGVHRRELNNPAAYIQTDAALNPGNSGGPLINKKGEVIGINNFKVGSAEGLGFALESNYIKEAVNDIYYQGTGENLV
jgi:S1-C subfamily serine protease